MPSPKGACLITYSPLGKTVYYLRETSWLGQHFTGNREEASRYSKAEAKRIVATNDRYSIEPYDQEARP